MTPEASEALAESSVGMPCIYPTPGLEVLTVYLHVPQPYVPLSTIMPHYRQYTLRSPMTTASTSGPGTATPVVLRSSPRLAWVAAALAGLSACSDNMSSARASSPAAPGSGQPFLASDGAGVDELDRTRGLRTPRGGLVLRRAVEFARDGRGGRRLLRQLGGFPLRQRFRGPSGRPLALAWRAGDVRLRRPALLVRRRRRDVVPALDPARRRYPHRARLRVRLPGR